MYLKGPFDHVGEIRIEVDEFLLVVIGVIVVILVQRRLHQERVTCISRKQEQTKFNDLRRGITKYFQRLAKFQKTLSKRKKHRF